MAINGSSIGSGRHSGSRPGSAQRSPCPSPLSRQLPLPPLSGMAPSAAGSVSGRSSSSASSRGPSPALQAPVQGLYAAPAKPSAVHDTAAAAAWSRPTAAESMITPEDAAALRSERAAQAATATSLAGTLSGAGPSRLPQSSRPSMRSRPPSSAAGSRSTSASASLLHLPAGHQMSGMGSASAAAWPSGTHTPGSVPMSPTATSNPVSGAQQSLTNASRAASGAASRSSSPPLASDVSSPSHTTKSTSSKRHKVTETNHLQLQTHQSGRRMINQYIIEDELGRGVHGKVRLAFDTETNERVAVKIVEREGRKRLGQGAGGWNARAARDHRLRSSDRADSEGRKEKWRESGTSYHEGVDAAELRAGLDRAANHTGGGLADARSDSGLRARFAPSPEPPRSPGVTGGSARPGRRSGDGLAAASDKDTEKQRLKDQRDKARKQLLWTTDKKVKREIAIMKKCAHENVVRLREVIDDPQSKKIFMVLEYMAGGEVVWKDERGFPTLTIEEARRTIRDVVLGLEYLHYQGIIHRDIKPANLLWDESRRVKISDFGVSHFSYALLVSSGGLPSADSDDEERARDPSLMDDHELAKTAGSPAFFAPELCMAGDGALTTASDRRSSRTLRTPVGEGGARKEFPWEGRASSTGSGTPGATTPPTATVKRSRPPVTKAIDVWALGVTLYCLLFGHTPFTADNEFALFAVIPNEDYELPAFAGADRMHIGPRRRRWRSLPMWTDEEGDVQGEELDGEPDADPRTLSEDARLLRDLLDRLLEKDPAKRIKLEDVKQHPWVLRDLEDAPAWLNDTDPAQHPFVEVTHEEVEDALTGFTKIKRRIRRWQLKLLEALAVGARRPRSKSASHVITPPFGMMRMTPGGGAAAQSGLTSESTSQQTSPLASPHGDEKRHRIPRPHFLFRRQHTLDGGDADSKSVSSMKPLSRAGLTLTPGRPSTAGMVSSRNHDGTRSQPASRPPSPGSMSSMGLSTPLTAGAAPLHAPADAVSMLRQISSYHGAASDRAAATMTSAAATPVRAPLFQRRSTSRSSRTLDGRGVTAPSHQRSSIEMRRPDTGNAEHDKHVFARPHDVGSHGQASGKAPPSRSGSSVLSRDFDASRPTTASSEQERLWQQHKGFGSRSPSLSQRHPSRNRLGELFRGVFHAPGLDHAVRRTGLSSGSRPGTASAQSPMLTSQAPAALSSSPEMPETDAQNLSAARVVPPLQLDTYGAATTVGPRSPPGVPASAPVSRLTISAAFGSQPLEPRAYSRPSSPHFRARDGFSPDSHGLSSGGPGHVELDDVDLDLELSDDDLDEEGRDPSRANSFLRNDGQGWVLHSHGGDANESSGLHHLSVGLAGRVPGMRRGQSAGARSMSPGASTSGSHAASPMYSEEGGASGSSESEHHLVIKTLTRGHGGGGAPGAVQATMGSYFAGPGVTSVPVEASTHKMAALDLDPVESRHAAALRRGSIAEDQHEVPFTSSRIAPSVFVSGVAGAVHAEHLSPSGSGGNMGDLSTASRFADADESRRSLSPSASGGGSLGGSNSPLLGGGAPSSDRTERPTFSDLDSSPREDLDDSHADVDERASGSGDLDDADEDDSGDEEESCFSFSAGRRNARTATATGTAASAA